MVYHFIMNPKSGRSRKQKNLESVIKDACTSRGINYRIYYTTCPNDATEYVKSMVRITEERQRFICVGGDGTINRFVNENVGLTLPKNLFYFAAGSGNDFKKDVADDDTALIPLHKYIKDLPTVTVNGKTSYFINGIGYGIDGYCCEEGDKIKAKSNKPVNYTAIAIKGLVFFFKPTNAKVTVDGVEIDALGFYTYTEGGEG